MIRPIVLIMIKTTMVSVLHMSSRINVTDLENISLKVVKLTMVILNSFRCYVWSVCGPSRVVMFNGETCIRRRLSIADRMVSSSSMITAVVMIGVGGINLFYVTVSFRKSIVRYVGVSVV